ncbi:hypothetical protein [Bradyrhizobium sp. BR 1432]|uniref:hypothetical protein n=1 Tax=Bradyrhizobium sp. BR 1432 TaxID=3447966 RepID=UPI003EE7F652
MMLAHTVLALVLLGPAKGRCGAGLVRAVIQSPRRSVLLAYQISIISQIGAHDAAQEGEGST